jgi:hypothetical protein
MCRPEGELLSGEANTTVQAPQSPSAQPSLVPEQWACSRNQSSTEVVGDKPLTSFTFPWCTKRIGCGTVTVLGTVDEGEAEEGGNVSSVLMPNSLARVVPAIMGKFFACGKNADADS